MNQYKLLVLPGDGIGPEIIDEGLALLKQIEIIDNCSFDISKELVGGAAIDAYGEAINCLLYTSPSPRDLSTSRMPSSA